MRKQGLVRTIVFAMLPLLLSGCGHQRSAATFAEADALFSQGNYPAALDRYRWIIGNDPAAGDRALFEMGIIQAHPKNGQKDYPQATASFQRLLADYPESPYRHDSEMMVFYLDTVTVKDGTIAAQQARIDSRQTVIDSLRHQIGEKENELGDLRRKIEALEKKLLACAVRKGAIDRILVEKKARRLTLFSRGEALRTFRVALGGNPVGPKERQGDNKTPEGIYVIDGRNRDSRYHLSLHISYPNGRDRKRARELGAPPGGDIMIHGIKNGFASVGNAHAEVDWTKGCIAVTDEEIEEIEKAAPNGTVVEIRP